MVSFDWLMHLAIYIMIQTNFPQLPDISVIFTVTKFNLALTKRFQIHTTANHDRPTFSSQTLDLPVLNFEHYAVCVRVNTALALIHLRGGSCVGGWRIAFASAPAPHFKHHKRM